MSDFTSDFWNLFVAIGVIASIIACGILLKVQSVTVQGKVETTGHVWDENIEEYNHPLPSWWKGMFYLTIIFGLTYLALFPGLGSFKGLLGWTSRGQLEQEQKAATEQYAPIFEKYRKMDVKAVAADKDAQEMGKRLFLTYCSQCHGSDAKGAKGFPNLTDADWLWGSDPEQIKAAITTGRHGMMPAKGVKPDLTDDQVKDVAHYVLSLSGRKEANTERAAKGKDLFMSACAACHGPEGKGNPALGAANLTDSTWLYGGSETAIIETIAKGRQGKMPAWGEFLGEAKIHLLTAYILSVSASK